MKEERDKIQKAIAEHEKKRNSIIGEYDLENKLKILEEHQPDTSFFIIDHMNAYIPNTIESRCKKIMFKSIKIGFLE